MQVAPTAFEWAHANWDNAARLDILRSGWGEGQTGSGDSALGARGSRGGTVGRHCFTPHPKVFRLENLSSGA